MIKEKSQTVPLVKQTEKSPKYGNRLKSIRITSERNGIAEGKVSIRSAIRSPIFFKDKICILKCLDRYLAMKFKIWRGGNMEINSQ
jgi:hypothetical protein